MYLHDVQYIHPHHESELIRTTYMKVCRFIVITYVKGRT